MFLVSWFLVHTCTPYIKIIHIKLMSVRFVHTYPTPQGILILKLESSGSVWYFLIAAKPFKARISNNRNSKCLFWTIKKAKIQTYGVLLNILLNFTLYFHSQLECDIVLNFSTVKLHPEHKNRQPLCEEEL